MTIANAIQPALGDTRATQVQARVLGHCVLGACRAQIADSVASRKVRRWQRVVITCAGVLAQMRLLCVAPDEGFESEMSKAWTEAGKLCRALWAQDHGDLKDVFAYVGTGAAASGLLERCWANVEILAEALLDDERVDDPLCTLMWSDHGPMPVDSLSGPHCSTRGLRGRGGTRSGGGCAGPCG